MPTPQIAINLLPGASPARRTRALRPNFQVPRGMPLVIAGSVLGILALVVVAVLLMGSAQQRTLARLRREWDALSPKRTAFIELQAEQARLDARLAVLTKLVEGRAVWAQRLNRLSDLVPDGVWFSRATIEPPSQLTLEGSALERTGEGMQAVSKLLSGLQGDQSFTSIFDQIALQSFTTRTVGSTELLDFTIVCSRDAPEAPTDSGAR